MPTRSRKYESWAWRIKGESATARRAWDEAEDALGRARALAEAIGQPRQRWMSQLAIGRLHAARGRREEALRALPRGVGHHRGSAGGDPGPRPARRRSSPRR